MPWGGVGRLPATLHYAASASEVSVHVPGQPPTPSTQPIQLSSCNHPCPPSSPLGLRTKPDGRHLFLHNPHLRHDALPTGLRLKTRRSSSPRAPAIACYRAKTNTNFGTVRSYQRITGVRNRFTRKRHPQTKKEVEQQPELKTTTERGRDHSAGC